MFIEGVEKLSNTYILTFNQLIMPKEIQTGYQIAKVDCCVSIPLRCYRCQKFGHHEEKCNGLQVCGKCYFVGDNCNTMRVDA